MKQEQKQKVFLAVLILFLGCLSLLVLSMYDNVKTTMGSQGDTVQTMLSDDMKLFLIGKAMELDPDYQPLQIDEEVPAEAREEIREKFEERLTESRNLLEDEKNFRYLFRNTVTGETIQCTEKERALPAEQDSLVYGELFYDAEGELECQGTLRAKEYGSFDSGLALDGFHHTYQYVNGIGVEEVMIGEVSTIPVETEQVRISVPSNLEVVYSIPRRVERDGGLIDYFANSWENYNSFSGVSLMVAAGLVGLFILVAPIHIVEKVNPFRAFCRMKAEVNLFLVFMGISLGAMAVMVVTGYTINGEFRELLELLGLEAKRGISETVNLLLWFLTLLLIALGFFDVKYMVAYGLWRYLRDDTWIGSVCRWIMRRIDQSFRQELSSGLRRQIFKLVLLNTLILILIKVLFGFGWLFGILYGVVLFFWLCGKMELVQRDYRELLRGVRELANGNFNDGFAGEVGVFGSVKEELANVRAGFEKAVQEETKSQNMKTELISNVSHDLKTPLTCIRNYVDLLQNPQISRQEREEYLEALRQYTDRLSRLIEDLFEVSKVNSGTVQLDVMEVNLVALIEQVQAECSDLLESRNLKVVLHTDSRTIPLNLDGDKSYRIFENLFTNIGKYAMPGSRVYVDIEDGEDEVRISFKNMSETEMNFTPEEIVERFVRGDKSRHERGSGLGLAIVKSFTEVQNGSFEIQVDGDLFKAILRFRKPGAEILQ